MKCRQLLSSLCGAFLHCGFDELLSVRSRIADCSVQLCQHDLVKDSYTDGTIAVLCAIGIAGRGLFFMLPQFKPVLALTIIAGVAFGGEVGFLVGAMTMLTSNMIFGQGPWTPWQMFAMGIIGFLAGVLFKKGWLRRTRASLAMFGVFTAVIIFGGIMNPAAVMASSESLKWETLIACYITGLPMDLVHGFGTVIFLMIAAEPMLEKMARIKIKDGIAD